MVINNLYLYLFETSASKEHFQSIFQTLTKQEKKIVRKYFEENGWEI